MVSFTGNSHGEERIQVHTWFGSQTCHLLILPSWPSYLAAPQSSSLAYTFICYMGLRSFGFLYSSFVQQRFNEYVQYGRNRGIKRYMILASWSLQSDSGTVLPFWVHDQTFLCYIQSVSKGASWDLELLPLCTPVVCTCPCISGWPGTLNFPGPWVSLCS